MANPFDQFDAPAANSFDQFDSQPQQYGNNDVLADGTRVPVGSPQAIAARSPVAGNSFLRNALLGVGKLDTDVGLGVQQMYASATGGNVAGLQAQAAQKRAVDAPLQATGGAKVGEIAGALPLGFVPGEHLCRRRCHWWCYGCDTADRTRRIAAHEYRDWCNYGRRCQVWRGQVHRLAEGSCATALHGLDTING